MRAGRGSYGAAGGGPISDDAWERIKRISVGLVLSCVLLAAESALARLRLPPFAAGGPWLGLLLVLAAGYLFDREHGGALGLITGLLAACMGPAGLMLRPLSYFLLGWLAGALAHSRLAHNLPSFAVFAAVGASAEGLFRYAAAAAAAHALPPASFFPYAVIPHIVMCVLFSPAVYGIVYAVRKFPGADGKWGGQRKKASRFRRENKTGRDGYSASP